MSNITYSQNREDLLLSGFFDLTKHGFYVDVGANHPIHDSVTKYFYDRGWRGINIEPNPNIYALLVEDRPRDINLQIGVSNVKGSLKLREYPAGDGLSTFSEAMKDDYLNSQSEVTEQHKDYYVDVYNLKEIFAEHQVKSIDFIKVDVEGFEYEVLEGNDWEKYRPKVICIEANHIIRNWRPMLKRNDYRLAFSDGLNEYYTDSRLVGFLDNYNFAKALDVPPISYEAYQQLQLLRDRANQETKKLVHQELINQAQSEQIRQLNIQLDSFKGIRKSAKLFLQSLDSAALAQIKRLNRPKIIKQRPLKIDENSSYSELIQQLQQYDKNNLLNSTAKDILIYRISMRLYKLIRRVTYLVLLRIFKISRGLLIHAK